MLSCVAFYELWFVLVFVLSFELCWVFAFCIVDCYELGTSFVWVNSVGLLVLLIMIICFVCFTWCIACCFETFCLFC